jgi:hypothetical protein
MTASEAVIVEEILPEVAWKRAGSQIVDGADWYQVTTASAPTIALNGIYRCKISHERLRHRLGDAIDAYAALNLPFRVFAGPSSTNGLSSLLEQMGFELSESSGMIASTEEIRAQVAPLVSVEKVNETTVDNYVDVSSAGWAMPDNLRSGLRSDLINTLESGDASLVYCLARYDGMPAGAATLKFTSQSAHLIGTSVHPSFRKRGVYQSLMAFRRDLAKTHGTNLVTTHAIKNTAAPLCAAMGMRDVATISIYSKS